MRRSSLCLYPGLAGGFCGLLAFAAIAQATAIGGTALPGHASLGPVVPAQGQPVQNVESSIAMLHQRLGITPAQEPAFAGFASVMRENARTSAGSPPPAGADAVQQLQFGIRYGQQEIDGMRRMLPALQTLYTSLSPQQRAIANQIFQQGPGR